MSQPPEQAPLPPLPRRRSWWRTGLIVAGVIMVLLFVRFGLFFARMVFDAERTETQAFEKLYTLMAEEYRQDPAAFETELASSANEAARRNPVTAGFELDERARVTDLGTALRVVTTMRGVFAGAKSTGRVTESESRTYFYDRGVTYLVVTCATGPSACGDRADLADRAERALLARLDRPVMDGILPDGGDCRSGRASDPARDRWLTCYYPSKVTLSLDRKDEEETRQLIRSSLLPEGRAAP